MNLFEIGSQIIDLHQKVRQFCEEKPLTAIIYSIAIKILSLYIRKMFGLIGFSAACFLFVGSFLILDIAILHSFQTVKSKLPPQLEALFNFLLNFRITVDEVIETRIVRRITLEPFKGGAPQALEGRDRKALK